ncbi:MAG: UbiX family flavin prenyltransferase [Desulfovibrio sp.]|nr:UbiX family flavin prenyltransferase [Desulfovibrio sp.]
MRKILVAVTGASGMVLPLKLMQMLAMLPELDTSCVVSPMATRVLGRELNEDEALLWALAKHAYKPDDLAAGPASGSWWLPHAGCSMVIAPCSMSTLGALASGCGSNLIHRAGDVALKEGCRLVLVPRETPLSRIHLRNMLALAEAGAVIMPFSPGFYFNPQNINEMLTQFCWRILDQLGIAHNGPQWGS